MSISISLFTSFTTRTLLRATAAPYLLLTTNFEKLGEDSQLRFRVRSLQQTLALSVKLIGSRCDRRCCVLPHVKIVKRTKGGKGRTAPMTPRVRETLKNLCEGGDGKYAFANSETGKAIT
jgi:hypothetical protein